MHAWLFRHRGRLRVILGLSAPPAARAHHALPAPDAPAGARPVRRMVSRRRRPRLRPGDVARRGALVVLLPMPRGRP